MTVQARFTTTDGTGVGRWRNHYTGAEDMREVRWACKYLAPTAQMRVMDGRTVVVLPQRVSEFLREER